jgi:hypothetical protein
VGIIVNSQINPPGRLRNGGATFDPNDLAQWREHVLDHGPREDIITHGETRLSVKGWVLGTDSVLPALRYWLGWSEVDYAAPNNPILRRYLPAAHPELNSCFARQVTINGWRYSHKQVPLDPPGLPVRVPFAKYHNYYMQIEFGSVDFAVRADASIGSEWERFVSITPKDATELVSIPAGIYRLVDPAGPLSGIPANLNAPLMIHAVERLDLAIKVWNLPLDFVCNGFRFPMKLAKAKGKVNRTEFLGMPPQTFLFRHPEIEIFPMPVATESWDTARFGCNLTIHGTYQEPVKKHADEVLAGWNLTPATDRLYNGVGWYGARTETTNKPMYSWCEMNNLLTHWSVNDLQVGQP